MGEDFLKMFMAMTPDPEPEVMHMGKPEHPGHDMDDIDEIKCMLKKIMCMLMKCKLDDVPEPKEGEGFDVMFTEDGEPDYKGAFHTIKDAVDGNGEDKPEPKKPEPKDDKPEDDEDEKKESPFAKAKKGGF